MRAALISIIEIIAPTLLYASIVLGLALFIYLGIECVRADYRRRLEREHQQQDIQREALKAQRVRVGMEAPG